MTATPTTQEELVYRRRQGGTGPNTTALGTWIDDITGTATGDAFTSFATWVTDAFNGDNDAIPPIPRSVTTTEGDVRTEITT